MYTLKIDSEEIECESIQEAQVVVKYNQHYRSTTPKVTLVLKDNINATLRLYGYKNGRFYKIRTQKVLPKRTIGYYFKVLGEIMRISV